MKPVHRGILVSVLEKGQKLHALAARQIREFEDECAARIGSDKNEILCQLLIELIADNKS